MKGMWLSAAANVIESVLDGLGGRKSIEPVCVYAESPDCIECEIAWEDFDDRFLSEGEGDDAEPRYEEVIAVDVDGDGGAATERRYEYEGVLFYARQPAPETAADA